VAPGTPAAHLQEAITFAATIAFLIYRRWDAHRNDSPQIIDRVPA